MKIYSTRERFLFGIGLLITAAGAAGVVGIMITQHGAVRDLWLWVALFGLVGGAYICLKIIITGRATPYLEQDVGDVLGFGGRDGPDDRAV